MTDEAPKILPYVQQLLDELEAEGIVARTGEMRRDDKTGKLSPVYVLTPKGIKQVEQLGRMLALADGEFAPLCGQDHAR